MRLKLINTKTDLKSLLSGMFLLCAHLLQAQFHTIGTARPMDGGCILLTPDEPYSEGIAYSTTTLDLSKNFAIEFDIYLGDKNDYGADGITFVVHNDPRGFQAFGTFGECLGYGRWSPEATYSAFIAPSIAVEFDTYQNPVQNDPSSDHVAFLTNGLNRHTSYWNNDNELFDMEDDRLHNFQFQWNASAKEIIVTLDYQVVYEGQHNLIEKIFNGNREVIWGFTASTGRKYNLQYFCLKRLAYLPNEYFDTIAPASEDRIPVRITQNKIPLSTSE